MKLLSDHPGGDVVLSLPSRGAWIEIGLILEIPVHRQGKENEVHKEKVEQRRVELNK